MLLLKYRKQTNYLFKLVIFLWGFVAVMAAGDIASDIKFHVGWSHILIEATVLLSSILCSAVLSYWFYKVSNSTMDYFKTSLDQSKNETEFWRNENIQLIKGLAEKIKQQFIKWHLTNAEAEIGFLLIKGFSLKEIAALRATSERTVREQARSIYQKAGIAGRSELTAYFLEDLLLPTDYEI